MIVFATELTPLPGSERGEAMVKHPLNLRNSCLRLSKPEFSGAVARIVKSQNYTAVPSLSDFSSLKFKRAQHISRITEDVGNCVSRFLSMSIIASSTCDYCPF